MDWFKEGMRVARLAPDRWAEIGEGHYRQARLERDAFVKTVEYEGSLRKQEERELLEEHEATPRRPFYVSIISFAEAVLWGVAAAFLIRAGYRLILITLPLLSKSGESSELVAFVLALGTAVALELLLRRLAEALPESSLRTWTVFIGLMGVLLFLACTLTQSLLRGEHDGARAALDLLNAPVLQVDGQSARKGDAEYQAIVSAFHAKSRQLGNMLNFLATGGLELTAAIALHECLGRLFPSAIYLIIPLRLRRVRRRIVNYAKQIAACQNRPELIKEEFSRGATIELARGQKNHSDNVIDVSPGKSLSIWMLIFIGLFIAAYIFLVSRVYAGDMVVALPDLTNSSAGEEMAKNFRTVDEIIAGLKPGARFVILPITDRSFSKEPILDARITAEPGSFGERARAGQRQLLDLWRAKSRGLKADSQRTDIFGALVKAGILFESEGASGAHLIVLSDMRHVTANYNFERFSKIDSLLIDQIEKDELVAPLAGVKVWILGAHAQGASEVYWMSLRKFWQTYFKKAGAELKTFSPDRRWNHE